MHLIGKCFMMFITLRLGTADFFSTCLAALPVWISCMIQYLRLHFLGSRPSLALSIVLLFKNTISLFQPAWKSIAALRFRANVTPFIIVLFCLLISISVGPFVHRPRCRLGKCAISLRTNRKEDRGTIFFSHQTQQMLRVHHSLL